ncbi:hypothetical protein CUR178_02009 [Leishmania enriettii]|uniref:ATP synthase regulation protein NCA2 n=1 Tax=Leishmania enriettii TaxID=5663 RepID=A0A836KL95_LEIEN|nr:hypothetical protein CUR178_02009 [Leishmania enriettii]
MNTHGVDVRTPIFYRHSFANALEAQSGKVYARLTNTPLIAESLPRGAASGVLIEQYAATHVHTLEDLERLLRAVLDETFGPNVGQHHTAASIPEGESDEPGTTTLSPPCASLPRVTAAAEDGMSREEAAAVSSMPRGGGADTRTTQPSHLREGGEPTAEKEARASQRSVSFLSSSRQAAPSFAAADPEKQEGSVAAGASPSGAAPRLWVWLCECVRRYGEKARLLFPTKDERLSAGARLQRGDSDGATPFLCSTSNVSAATAANSTVGRVGRARVPQWVRAPFAPLPAFSAAHVSTSGSAAHSMRWPRLPVPALSISLSESAAGSQRSETLQNMSPDTAVIVHASQQLSAADKHGDADTDRGGVRHGDEDAASSHLTQTPCRHTHGSSLVNGGPASMPPGIQPTPVRLASTSSFTVVSEAEDATTANGRGTHPPSSPRKAAPVSASATGSTRGDGTCIPLVPSPTTPQQLGCHDISKEGSLVGVKKIHTDRTLPLPRLDGGSSRASAEALGASTDPHKAGLALSFSHAWIPGDEQAQSIPPTRKFAAKKITSVASCWGKHACASELTGWLHLLVWVRWQVIHFLRDLSGVQGFVAWSAWYWSWAQEHAPQAAFHLALSSASFWRGVWSHGLHAQLSQVQYEMRRHMFTLKSVFQLIVSYIGAAYTALEQLNTLVVQVQRNCEVMMPPAAAAAAAAVARAPAAANGSSLMTLPVSATYANAGRGGRGGAYDFGSTQNSIIWSPIAAGIAGGGASPLAPWLRDRAGSPPGVIQSAFASAAAQGASGERHDVHDEAERQSDTSISGEDIEAASALRAMDELRRALSSMLQELKVLFCSGGLPLDVLEVSDQARFPCGGGGGPSAAGVASASTARADTEAGLHQPGESGFFGASDLGEAAAATRPSVPQAHFTEAGVLGALGGSERSESRQMSAREGARALLQCVQCSQLLLRRLTLLVQRSHSPPTGRHWRRILVAAVSIVPPFLWVYTKSPAELAVVAQRTVMVGRQILRSYVIDPVTQLRESLFYIRPGVEDRRGAVERDAVSLANIIRDFHEDMYPNMPTKQLDELRQRTLERLRAGVADTEVLGLIDEQYRRSVRHPIRSILFGHLPRIMLIQLSYQALEVSRVANGIDEVLEGNDVNFKIMAMMPVFLAAGLLATWSLFRYRVKYKPVCLRMKLLWRSLFRVISFAGSGQGVVLPYVRITEQQHGACHHADATAHVINFPRSQTKFAGAVDWSRRKKGRSRKHSGVAAAGAALGSSLPSRNTAQDGSEGMDDAVTAAFSEPRGDEASSSDESCTAAGGVATTRQLNNYEQGMVLLLSHVMRSTATEYLHSYAFFHELMEDLNDLESVHSTRHQRLATLTRMRATHSYFF